MESHPGNPETGIGLPGNGIGGNRIQETTKGVDNGDGNDAGEECATTVVQEINIAGDVPAKTHVDFLNDQIIVFQQENGMPISKGKQTSRHLSTDLLPKSGCCNAQTMVGAQEGTTTRSVIICEIFGSGGGSGSHPQKPPGHTKPPRSRPSTN